MEADDVARRPDRVTVAEKITRHAVFLARLAARNPLTPFRVHVLRVEIGRFEHMHVAVESAKTILSHDDFSKIFAMNQNSRDQKHLKYSASRHHPPSHRIRPCTSDSR